MMKKYLVALAASLALSSAVSATPIGSVTINGADFLQSFSITNNSTAGESIVGIIYDLGTPGNGIATWDTGTGGGTASNFLSNPRWFQTITWLGLNITTTFSLPAFSLDIDYIDTLAPLDIEQGIIDNIGTTLANATFTLLFSDGSTGTASLNQTGWTVNQSFRIVGRAVSEPAPFALLAMGALLAMFGRRRRA